MKTWHYGTPESGRAQTTEDKLAALVAAKQITPATLVWAHGMTDWLPASAALPHLFGGGPPPLANVARAADTGGRGAHAIDYTLRGDDMQLVEIELDPGETVIAEAGAMCFMDGGIQFETKMGDGSSPSGGLFGALKTIGKRMISGESIFMTHFTNRGSGKQRVAFAAPYPGKIIPFDLRAMGGTLLCERGAFLCAAFGTQISLQKAGTIATGLFGGEGLFFQKLTGDGLAFIHSGGTIIERELRGETLRLDTGCLVALTPTLEYSFEKAGNLKSMILGGEGLFLATVKGHGKVWIQSLPFSRLADRVLASAPSSGGTSTGEGSVLGGLGRLIDGS